MKVVALWSLIGALTLVAPACRTQRWIGPMEPNSWPLPPGAGTDYVPGLEEVVAVRHSDPVAVRRAGENSTFPLDSLNRRERLRSGAWVVTRAGGHAEVFWPLQGTSILFHEEGALRIGEQSRGEPCASFERITRATVKLSPGSRVALPTGAELSGDAARESGPYSLEARYPNLLRISNDSKETAYVSYRREVLPLGPGQSVDLALLAVGTGPVDVPPGGRRFLAGQVAVDLEGSAEVREVGPGVVIESKDTGRVRGLGVEVELNLDRAALFLPLGASLGSVESGPIAGLPSALAEPLDGSPPGEPTPGESEPEPGGDSNPQ